LSFQGTQGAMGGEVVSYSAGSHGAVAPWKPRRTSWDARSDGVSGIIPPGKSG